MCVYVCVYVVGDSGLSSFGLPDPLVSEDEPSDRQMVFCLCVVCKNSRPGVWQGRARRSRFRNVPFYFWRHPHLLLSGLVARLPPAPPPSPRLPPAREFLLTLNK